MSQKLVLFKLKDVHLGYGPKRIFRNLSLEIRQGDYWFILGKNGCGKTTLLKLLLGLIKPQSGQFFRDSQWANPACLGFIPQENSLNPYVPTTVYEMVSLGLVGLKKNREEAVRCISQALEAINLYEKRKENFWSLSKGQRQKALIARALVRQPQVILMDEPTLGLDFVSEADFIETVNTLHKTQNITPIIVTHDLRLTKAFGTHALLIGENGCFSGPKEEVLREKHFQSVFDKIPLDFKGNIS